ncbi:MAG: rane protein [Chloroflexi bacterium]|nr:rane protein [Chloroflexota bacterium]
MTLEGIVIGVLGIVLGAAFCFAGFRWFLLLLPIWGLFAGFMVGAQATAALLGEGFLAGVLGIVVGVILAIVFAVLSYLYWWGAVLVVAGSLGYWLTGWLLSLIGFTGDGLVITIIALAGGAALALVALLVNAPKYVAIILTAFAGAAWLVAGFALIPALITKDDLANGALVALYKEGWLWIVLWAVAAAAGIIAQLQMTRRWQQDIVVMMEERRPF